MADFDYNIDSEGLTGHHEHGIDGNFEQRAMGANEKYKMLFPILL